MPGKAAPRANAQGRQYRTTAHTSTLRWAGWHSPSGEVQIAQTQGVGWLLAVTKSVSEWARLHDAATPAERMPPHGVDWDTFVMLAKEDDVGGGSSCLSGW
ncbi:hypothetical protein [Cerasicoccus maritimus]|uniref:hypothetical protein n=1 Tax=Cerasicoccus maritimus TaxID=490089 RepID=UPI0028527E0F|nr:hypothetical protein [Cerasicoccus maritimus]